MQLGAMSAEFGPTPAALGQRLGGLDIERFFRPTFAWSRAKSAELENIKPNFDQVPANFDER